MEDTTKTCCKNTTQEQTCQSQEKAEQGELNACMQQREEWKNKFLRVQADFDNFTRRIEKEKVTWLRVGQSSLLKELLSIVDDVDRALVSEQKAGQDSSVSFVGFTMMAKSLHKLLQAHGVEEISEVTTFDPLLHEALVQVEIPERQSGDIVEVLQKGYMFKGEVLRPAKVSVAK